MSGTTQQGDNVNGNGEAREVEILRIVMDALCKVGPTARMRILRTATVFFEAHPDSNFLKSEPPPSSVVISSAPSLRFSDDRTPSAKQFILDKRPKTDVDRIVCLAYYLAHYKLQSEFKTADLTVLNSEAAQAKLGNPARAVESATRSGFLIPTSRGQKQVSALGEIYVENLPDHERARNAVDEQRHRKRSKK